MVSSSLQWVKVAIKPIVVVAVVLMILSWGFGRSDAMKMGGTAVTEFGWGLGGATSLIRPFFEAFKDGQVQVGNTATPKSSSSSSPKPAKPSATAKAGN